MDYRQRYTKAGKNHVRNKHLFPIEPHGKPQTAGDQNQRNQHHPQQKHDLLLFFLGYRFFPYIILVLLVEGLQYLCTVA